LGYIIGAKERFSTVLKRYWGNIVKSPPGLGKKKKKQEKKPSFQLGKTFFGGGTLNFKKNQIPKKKKRKRV